MAEISVIIPVYQVERYIEDCIRSVLSQTFRDIEVILINDGSPDRSGSICEAYARKDRRIKYSSTPNQGVGPARNLGMALASGKWLCFVDGDDYLPASALEDLLLFSDGADIVIGDYWKDQDGRIRSRRPMHGGEAGEKPQRYRILGYTLMCRSCCGARDIFNTNTPWGKLYRRSFCRENQLEFPAIRRSEDVIFNINAYQATDRIRFTERKVYYYRLRSDSVEHRYIPDLSDTVEKFLLCLKEALRPDQDPQLADFYNHRKVRLLISSIRRSYAHASCPMSRQEKLLGIRRLCEICSIKPGCFRLNREVSYFNQRFLSWLLLNEHYAAALSLFELQRTLFLRS